jgi:hypothetical protein
MVARILNPDDYLLTSVGRVYTNERNAAAWEQLYVDMEALFAVADPDIRFFLVMGVQGAGKTTWIRANHEALGVSAIFLDAAVPAKRHRARALSLARGFGIRTTAIWINSPLEVALARNAQRASVRSCPRPRFEAFTDCSKRPQPMRGSMT